MIPNYFTQLAEAETVGKENKIRKIIPTSSLRIPESPTMPLSSIPIPPSPPVPPQIRSVITSPVPRETLRRRSVPESIPGTIFKHI